MEEKKESETRKVEFVIEGEPFGKQRPRVFQTASGRSKAITPKGTVIYENLVRISYRMAAAGYCFPDDASIMVQITAYYSVPASASRKRKEEMLEGKIRPTKKPDFDNIGKVICDSLNKMAYKDDSAIVEAHINKYYSNNPRVKVVLSEIK